MERIHAVLAAAIAVVMGGTALARTEEGTSREADPFFQRRGIDDRAAFFIGGMRSLTETRVQIDSELGFGSTLILERIFNLPRERDYPRFQGYYRFTRTQRIDFRYLRVSGEGRTVLLDEEIRVGPFTFEIGAAVGARHETRLGVVDYRYAFANTGRAEAGIVAGLGIVDTDLSVFGEVGVSPGPVLRRSEGANETIPLPVIGVYTDFTLARRLFLSMEGLFFSAGYDRYSGNVTDFRAALRWYPTKIFGFGVALNRTRVDVVVEFDRGDVRVDFLLEGPSAFLSFLVPGLR